MATSQREKSQTPDLEPTLSFSRLHLTQLEAQKSVHSTTAKHGSSESATSRAPDWAYYGHFQPMTASSFGVSACEARTMVFGLFHSFQSPRLSDTLFGSKHWPPEAVQQKKLIMKSIEAAFLPSQRGPWSRQRTAMLV